MMDKPLPLLIALVSAVLILKAQVFETYSVHRARLRNAS